MLKTWFIENFFITVQSVFGTPIELHESKSNIELDVVWFSFIPTNKMLYLSRFLKIKKDRNK